MTFSAGEDLTASDILEAPGEVIGRSSYGTVYRACLRRTGSTVLLRFVRPACIGSAQDIVPLVKTLASVTHGNLVPLKALYVGPRGEKLFVHPFYAAGTLAQFLRGLSYLFLEFTLINRKLGLNMNLLRSSVLTLYMILVEYKIMRTFFTGRI